MFYKALGFAVWKLAKQEFRRRYGRQLRVAAVAGVVAIAAAGYLATRSGE
jgi:hypothetical protein